MAKAYTVKEIYYTLQGEGAHAGRPAVFLRFAGCNLWTGREEDRARARCTFCDTDFVGMDGHLGGRYDAAELAAAVISQWPKVSAMPFVVCTGGEPLLQLDSPAIQALHDHGCEIAVETNGTIKAPAGIDWITVSPKSDEPLEQLSGSELKLVFPQQSADPRRFEHLDFEHFYIQPMDGPDLAANIEAAIEFCRRNPSWKLSLQTHKLIGIP